MEDDEYRTRAFKVLGDRENARVEASDLLNYVNGDLYFIPGGSLSDLDRVYSSYKFLRGCNRWTIHSDDKQVAYDYNRFASLNASLSDECLGRKVYVEMVAPLTTKQAFVHLCAAKDNDCQVEVVIKDPHKDKYDLPLYVPADVGDVITLKGQTFGHTEHVIALRKIDRRQHLFTYCLSIWSTRFVDPRPRPSDPDEELSKLDDFEVTRKDDVGKARDFAAFRESMATKVWMVDWDLNVICFPWSTRPDWIMRVAQQVELLNPPKAVTTIKYLQSIPVTLHNPPGTRLAVMYKAFTSIARYLGFLPVFRGEKMPVLVSTFETFPADFANDIILHEFDHASRRRGRAKLREEEMIQLCRMILDLTRWSPDFCQTFLSNPEDPIDFDPGSPVEFGLASRSS